MPHTHRATFAGPATSSSSSRAATFHHHIDDHTHTFAVGSTRRRDGPGVSAGLVASSSLSSSPATRHHIDYYMQASLTGSTARRDGSAVSIAEPATCSRSSGAAVFRYHLEDCRPQRQGHHQTTNAPKKSKLAGRTLQTPPEGHKGHTSQPPALRNILTLSWPIVPTFPQMRTSSPIPRLRTPRAKTILRWTTSSTTHSRCYLFRLRRTFAYYRIKARRYCST